MKTRMEKYYRSTKTNSRSSRNEKLYKTIYDMGEYTNVEGIVNIEKTGEIDLAKIRELLNQTEKEKERYRIVKERVSEEKAPNKYEDLKKYDIHEIINKARSIRPKEENNYRSLDSTQYNILKKIKLSKDKKEYVIDEDGLRELIHTITNTSMLNKLGDKELSLELLSSLKGSGHTEVYDETFDNDNLKESIDKSFFTSSMNFKKDDFEDLNKKEISKNNLLIKILYFILFASILGVSLYFIYTFFKP